MPSITDQIKLLNENELEFISQGPVDGMWRAEYLLCPLCNYYVLKGPGYDECTCGNIRIDSDYLRISVSRSNENEIKTFNAKKKS